MRWLLPVLVVLLGALILTERLLREQGEAHRLEASALRPLTYLPAERVRSFRVQLGRAPQAWTYVRRRGAWRFPDYYDAFVEPARVDQLLGNLLQSAGTVVSASPEDRTRFGLIPEQALNIELMDRSGAMLAAFQVGRGTPGPGAEEAYVKRADADTIFHLHTNPRRALGPGAPPMLDPRVLPRALPRKPVVRIGFARGPSYPLQTLRRQETAPATPFLPGMPPQGPMYAWLATFEGREDTCVNASAFAYVGFLSRLRYQELRDPRGKGYGFEKGNRLQLEDEEGIVDVLEVGGQDRAGNTFLRHLETGQVFTIAPAAAELLFPARPALLDTLPHPSPYQLAAP